MTINICDTAHEKGGLSRSILTVLFLCFVLFFVCFVFSCIWAFLSFKMTPHSSKLIKAFKCYNWKRSKILFFFFIIIFWIFSSVSKKVRSCKLPPFDVLHHKWITWDSYVHICVAQTTEFLHLNSNKLVFRISEKKKKVSIQKLTAHEENGGKLLSPRWNSTLAYYSPRPIGPR